MRRVTGLTSGGIGSEDDGHLAPLSAGQTKIAERLDAFAYRAVPRSPNRVGGQKRFRTRVLR
jgi:hypothetical protein